MVEFCSNNYLVIYLATCAGRPDAPLNIFVRCSTEMLASLSAEVNWTPGRENYAPILNFVIQFNTTFNPDTWIDIADNITQNERSRVVNLSPWANYTFRILARNKVCFKINQMLIESFYHHYYY